MRMCWPPPFLTVTSHMLVGYEIELARISDDEEEEEEEEDAPGKGEVGTMHRAWTEGHTRTRRDTCCKGWPVPQPRVGTAKGTIASMHAALKCPYHNTKNANMPQSMQTR